MANKPTNYRKWAFRFLIYIVVLNFAIALKVATLVDTSFITGRASYDYTFVILVGLALLFTLGGITFTVLSVIYQEEKDFKYKVCVWGYPVLIILSFFLSKFT